MDKSPDVTIVIVNFNTRELTARCIDSVLASQARASFEIVVVDNASVDGSADYLEMRYPCITLIRSLENRGVAGGNNLGIRAGQGRHVLLLNSDTLLLPGALDRAINFLDTHPCAGGAGGKLLNPDRTFQSCFVDFPSLWQVFLITTKIGQLVRPRYPSYGPCPQVREVDWISSAFMLFRREAIEQVGLVDEAYFLYCDETDLQYRLKQAGWKIYYLPDVETIHLGGGSASSWRRRRLVYRGYLLFFRKHRGALQTMVLRALFAAASGLKLPLWAAASLWPAWREQARRELFSHRDIVHMCFQKHIPWSA